MTETTKGQKAIWWKKEHGKKGAVIAKIDGDQEDVKKPPPSANMANLIVRVSCFLDAVYIINCFL
jgi:hypothetical protein